MTQSKMIKITLVKSVIGRLEAQKRTVKALGLKKIRCSVVKENTPVIAGMVDTVKHLITVENVA